MNQTQFPVFLVIGYQGTPDNPGGLSLIPITELKYKDLFESTLKKFSIEKGTAVPSSRFGGDIKSSKIPVEDSLPVEKEVPHQPSEPAKRSKKGLIAITIILFAVVV